VRVVFATETVSVMMPGGYPALVQKGSHWRADDPLVLSHPDLFSEDPRYGMSYSQPQPEDPPIEQMTADPGERRAVARPHADEAFEEMERLREEARRRGVRVDPRWSLARLREEMAGSRG